MGYKVLSRFKDVDGRVYVEGERYSKALDEDREVTLTTNNNKYHKPFLKKLGGSKPLSDIQKDEDLYNEYESLTVAELKKVADSMELSYNSKIRKNTLVDKIISKTNK